MQDANDLPAQSDAADLAAWLRLSLTPGIGNQRARQLLRTFGLPQQIFETNHVALGAVVSATQALALSEIPPARDSLLRTTLDWLAADPQHRRMLTLGDPAYPRCLLEMEDPPLILYGMGRASSWETLADGSSALDRAQAAGIAIVGSRNPTPQGASNAHDFAQALAYAGLTVVSGMALGVDAAAHAGALQAAGVGTKTIATIAVVGTGLDRVYPKQHRELAHQIAQGGVILSEYHLGTPPLASNFPQRNRLIAALSRGTLVVEAALQSGSLITARLALEQGRDVFAIPGSIHSTQSKGCHALIKQGAKLVESAQDILEELQFATPTQPATIEIEPDRVSPTLAALLQALGFDPIGLDGLQARSGQPTPHLQAQLMELELLGMVARLPGGKFQRIARA